MQRGACGSVAGKISEIQEEGAPVRVLVVRTDEELEIALQAEAVMAPPPDWGCSIIEYVLVKCFSRGY